MRSRRRARRFPEALFDHSVPTVSQKRIELMRRVGDEFGLKLEDFETSSKFGAAVREKIGQIKLQPGGALALAAIEKKVGLDKLGISLDDFVDAMMDPGGDEAKNSMRRWRRRSATKRKMVRLTALANAWRSFSATISDCTGPKSAG